MTYSSVVAMGQSNSLQQRVAACAAEQGNLQPALWAQVNLLSMSADPSFNWSASWDTAVAESNVNVNPDTGVRNDVVTDAMILTAVQSRKSSQTTDQQDAQSSWWPWTAPAVSASTSDSDNASTSDSASASTSDSASESATAQ